MCRILRLALLLAVAIPVSLVYDAEGKLAKSFNNDAGEYGKNGFNYKEHISAQVDELQARYDAAVTIDRVMSNTLGEELELAREKLGDARDRERDLLISSPLDGTFVPLDPAEDLPGQFLRRGTLIGYVIPHTFFEKDKK